LDEFEIRAGSAELEAELPMPGVARLRLEREGAESVAPEGRGQP
jgi:hypothetical protein